MNSSFKNLKPYALIELVEAKAETHLVIVGQHFEFSDVRFYVDADLMFDRHNSMKEKGIKTIMLNTNALLAHFYKHEADCIGAELGIDAVNYSVKQ